MHAAALRYFEAVARSGSVRQASERLNVAASAIDRQILKLEIELGVQLFERLPRGMRLTAAGELVIRHIRSTLYEFDRLKGEIAEIKGVKSGRVRIVCLDSLMVRSLPSLISAFHQRHPGVSFAVAGGPHGMIVQQLTDGEADIGITFDLPSAPDLEHVEAVPMPIVAMMARNHPLAGRRAIGVDDCCRFPFLQQEEARPIRSLLDVEVNSFAELGPPLVVANNLMLLKALIADGIGIAFYTPIGFLEELASGSIVALPLKIEAFSKLRLGLLRHRRRKPTPAAAAVLDLLKQLLVQLSEQAQRLIK
jgi:DNA-binding transcriptional LysR family regulator